MTSDINIRMSDELEAFRTSLEALDINTQTTLRTIATRLDVNRKVEHSTLQLLPSRIRDVTASSSNSIVVHQNAVGVVETKPSYSGNGRSFEDITRAHSTPRYLQNADLEQRLCKKLADMNCTCGASNRKISNRSASWTYRFWGGLTVSRQGDVRASHRPGCIFFQKSKRNISRTSATYFGLLSFFSQSFTVSLTQEYTGGPYSVSFGLQPCNIVKSSPAFQLFALRSGKYDKTFHPHANGNALDHLVDSLIKELRRIYGSGKASPFDIYPDGNNAAHVWLEACLTYFSFGNGLKSKDLTVNAICKMLTYLKDVGVPIAASNFDQLNLLTISMYYRNLWAFPTIYKLVIIHDSNFYDTELVHTRSDYENLDGFYDSENLVSELNTFCEYPEICQDVGFSELFLSVITKDYRKLEAILAEEDSLLDISQTDLYRRNILHASCNWPDGLRLLLQRQDVRHLMEMPDRVFRPPSPLDYALSYSKLCCNSPDQWTECNDCTCYTAVQLLLEADCEVPITARLPETLAGCSLKARKLFFKHLKDRRLRLRNIALNVLPEMILNQYGVATSPFPDKTANLLWIELHHSKYQKNHGLCLPGSLRLCADHMYCLPESLFEFPHDLRVVELALDYGFRPRDENGVPPLLSGSYIIPHLFSWGLEVFVEYLDWLLQQNLSLELSLEPFSFSILHRIAVFIGILISDGGGMEYVQLQRDLCISELQDSRMLLPAVFGNKSQCNIPCPCSSGIFTRPLAYILPAMLRHRGDSQFGSFFSQIGEQIELVVTCIDLLKLSEHSSEYSYMARCAIHILAMMSLGVRHLPICLTEDYWDIRYSMGNEDWKELLDEDRELIGELEALDEEFGDVFDHQNVSIEEFLQGYWLTRMEEVIQELHNPLTHDDRYELLEAGVVLEEDNADGSKCCEDMIR